MGKIYERNCDFCKKRYEGWGAKYCSPKCGNASRRGVSTTDSGIPTPRSRKSGPEESIQTEYGQSSATIDVRSITVSTLDGAIKAANVDLEKWAIERHKINSWQVTAKINDKLQFKTNWQVTVWLRPKISPLAEVGFLNLVKQMPLTTLKFPKFKRCSDYAAELALYDAHFGKLAWSLETGRPSYDLDLAVSDYLSACGENLEDIAYYNPEVIYFVVGQDLMHVENFLGVTPKGGNVLDVDSRFPKLYEKAMETVLRAVYECRKIAPVEVIWIPGNHDMHASMHLCYAIREHFRKDKQVTVDVSPCQRKSRLFGNLLVGWTHEISNKENSWSNELAQAFPEKWGKSVFREWHYGHKHKKKETKTFPTMTEGGVLMRQLSALSVIDAWHFENLFTDAVPGAEAFIWTKDRGIKTNLLSLTRRTADKEGQ